MSDVSINYKGSEIASMNVSGTKTLTTQGKYCEDNITINYTKPTPVEVESKDVDFYDYDGTRLYSYTKQEFLALTEMPANPTHDGLTSQGWNWSLADAKDYVGDMGGLDIGQMFGTPDNKLQVHIRLEEGRLEPYCFFAVNGTATIEWGDGTSDTVVGTSTSTPIYTQHTYSSAGEYLIKIGSESNIYLSRVNYSIILTKQSSTNGENRVYKNAIKEINFSSNVLRYNNGSFLEAYGIEKVSFPSNIDSRVFSGGDLLRYCHGLKYLVVPTSATELGVNVFASCTSLKGISIPKETSALKIGVFSDCYNIKKVWLPKNIRFDGNSCFDSCWSLSSIKIYNIPTIQAQTFIYCYGIKTYFFLGYTAVPTLANTNAFTNISSDCKIVVPDSLYATWITATNWSNYASYIVKESEYVG